MVDWSLKWSKLQAKWSDLSQLYQLEQSQAVTKNGARGLSNLTKVAVQPELIERKNMLTCLRVFSDEMLNAMKVCPSIDKCDIKGTVLFIDKIIKL